MMSMEKNSVEMRSAARACWAAHVHVVGGDWFKTLVWADREGLWGQGFKGGQSLWVSWGSVSDISVDTVRGWQKRVCVVLTRYDGSMVKLLVSSPRWWGFYPPIAAVEAANALRECRAGEYLR